MVKVIWMSKKVVGNEVIREVKSAKDFKKPQKFDAFIDSIAKTFGIKKKRNISLILINNDNEETPISNQEDFDDFLDDLKEFKFYLEEGEQSEPQTKKKESKKEDLKSKDKDESDEENKPEKKKEDDDDGNDEDEDGEGGNDGLPADVSDKEIEKIFDSLIKPIPELDDDLNDDNQFDKEAYSKQLNDNFTKAVNQFKNVFDEKINKIIEAKSQIMTNSISSLIKDFSKIHLKNLDDISDKTNGLQEGFSTIMTNTNEMNDAIGQLKGEITGEKKPKGKKKEKKDGMIEEEDDEPNDDKIQFKFLKENIEEEIDAKKCKWFDIKDVQFQYFGENIFKKNIFFVRDPKESSEDIFFLGNTKTDTEANEYTIDGAFKAGDKGSHLINLKINEPKIGKQYKLCLYLRTKVDGPNLSKPLFIIIKVKENEEDIKRKKEEEMRREEKRRRENEEKIKEEERKREEEKKRQEEKKRRQEEEEKKKQEEEKRKQEEEEKKRQEEEEKTRQEEEKRKQEEEEKKRIEEEKKKQEANKDIDYKGLDPAKVNDLYEELEQEFNLSSIMDKNVVIEKIIEGQCEREAMNDWIFEKL